MKTNIKLALFKKYNIKTKGRYKFYQQSHGQESELGSQPVEVYQLYFYQKRDYFKESSTVYCRSSANRAFKFLP